MSAQGQSVPDIAHLLDCSLEYVRTAVTCSYGTHLSDLDRVTLKPAATRSRIETLTLGVGSYAQ
jgi:hypothetical protein